MVGYESHYYCGIGFSEEAAPSLNRKRRAPSPSHSDDSEDDSESDSVQWLETSEVQPPPENVERFLKATFSKCLPQAKRRQLYKMYPRADIPLLHSPVADKDISNVLGRDFPIYGDQQQARIQSAVLAASGPLIGLWSDLSRQGFSGKSEELMPVKAVIEVCQQTLALIGNASCYINESRRNDIISKIKQKRPRLGSFLQDVCKDLGEPSRELFGPTAKKRISERAQTIKDFNESLRSLDSLDKSSRQSSRGRFLGKDSRTRYGGTPGLSKKPYINQKKVFQPLNPAQRRGYNKGNQHQQPKDL